jgi:hypothetical protein
MAAKKDGTKANPKKAEVETSKIIKIADLSEEYGIEAKDIRIALRANGMKAPAVERAEGDKAFGPRARYEWAENSEELKKVRAIIEASLEEADSDDEDAEDEE